MVALAQVTGLRAIYALAVWLLFCLSSGSFSFSDERPPPSTFLSFAPLVFCIPLTVYRKNIVSFLSSVLY